MLEYYWVKMTHGASWEPAARLRAPDGTESWLYTGMQKSLLPAVIGPKLEAPADGS